MLFTPARVEAIPEDRTGICRAAFCLTFASAVSILFSIAISQILMTLALAALLVSGERLRFPPIRLPLGLFFGATVAALLLSGDPRAGLPQIRKFFVFAIALLICSTFRRMAEIRRLALAWSAVAGLSALVSMAQFAHNLRHAPAWQAGRYDAYLAERVTGLASHWMTMGGEEMIVLLLLLAWLLFSPERQGKILGWICLPLLAAAVVLSFSRSIFLLGAPLGAAYLIGRWKPRLLAVVPAIALLALLAAPRPLRQRAISVVKPHGQMDSNQRRAIMRRAGWAMIRAHPWFGIGPEQVSRQFLAYVPGDVARPLPPGWYGHLHNVYLQYAAERGLPALAAMLWLIGKVLHDLFAAARRMREPDESAFVIHGTVAVVLALLAQGFFEYNLGDSEVLTLFLGAVSAAYVAIRPAR